MLRIEGTDLFLGEDKRVYRQTQGVLEAFVPVEGEGESRAELTRWATERVPPRGQLRALYEGVMKKYRNETFLWWGESREKGGEFVWMVPDQVGDMAGVDVEDEVAMLQLSERARWGGSVHTHPGMGAEPSGIDRAQWTEAQHSGVHFIVARDLSYTVNAVVGGLTFTVERGRLPRAERMPELMTSDGLEVDCLLEKYEDVWERFKREQTERRKLVEPPLWDWEDTDGIIVPHSPELREGLPSMGRDVIRIPEGESFVYVGITEWGSAYIYPETESAYMEKVMGILDAYVIVVDREKSDVRVF